MLRLRGDEPRRFSGIAKLVMRRHVLALACTCAARATNRLRVFSKLKHDLRLRSADSQLSVCAAVLARVRCVDQKLTS
jgi:hypothetical protein